MDLTNIFSVIYLLLVSWIIFHWKKLHVKNIRPIYTTSFFILKVFVGWSVGCYYKAHYSNGGDTFNFLLDANTIYSYLFTAPSQFFRIMSGIDTNNVLTTSYLKPLGVWYNSGFDSYYNDARIVVKINVLIRFISFGVYQIHVIWMNVISFIGLRWIYLFFNSGIKKAKVISFLPFVLPSVLIWGSALLKEPVMIFSVGWFLISVNNCLVKCNRKNDLLLLFPILFLCFVKIYLLLILLPGIIILGLQGRNNSAKGRNVILTYLFSLLLILALGNYFPSLNLPALLLGKQMNTLRFSVFMHAASYMHPLAYAPDVKSFLLRFPEAVWYAMKPFPHHVNSLQWIFIFETYALLILIFISLIKGKIKTLLASPKLMTALCTTIGLLALIGYTNMVYGSMIRYRMMAFLLLGIVFCSKNYSQRKIGSKNLN